VVPRHYPAVGNLWTTLRSFSLSISFYFIVPTRISSFEANGLDSNIDDRGSGAGNDDKDDVDNNEGDDDDDERWINEQSVVQFLPHEFEVGGRESV
jgi:hypothetical protein